MPLVVRPGAVLPIPCRACRQAFAKFQVLEGTHQVRCAKCTGETRIEAFIEGGVWRIKTAAAAVVSEAKKK